MRRLMMVLFILFIVFFLCTSCAISNNDQKLLPSAPRPQTDEPILPTDDTNTTDAVPGSVPELPLYLPLPYSYVFGFQKGDIDAFLHDTAVNNYSTRVDPKDGDLLLPSLRLIDTWDAEDGGIYYLCFMRQINYYELAKSIINGTPFDDGMGVGLGEVVRFKVVKDDFSYYYEWACTELLESPPSGDSGYSIRYMCGDNTELADMIINSPKDVPYIRDILPFADDKAALLDIYLEYFQLK